MTSTQHTRGSGSLSCLLCNAPSLEPAERLIGRDIRALWRALDRNLSETAMGEIRVDTIVALFRCRTCGFEFFDPRFVGNGVFYQELEHGGYYTPYRPEFERALPLIRQRGLKRVLDVGCGAGAFLDLARSVGCQTFGIELSAAAAAKARANGHVILEKLLHELDCRDVGKFDLISLFQVLEHLPDPVRVIHHAAGFLKDGGILTVAVPSASGVYKLSPLDPHQWPPHHTSRWRLGDLRKLAEVTELQLINCGGDVLVGTSIEHHWKLQNKLAPVVGRPPRLGGDWLPRCLSQVYRKLGVKFILPGWGSSIYAHYRPK